MFALYQDNELAEVYDNFEDALFFENEELSANPNSDFEIIEL